MELKADQDKGSIWGYYKILMGSGIERNYGKTMCI